jgi:hypothetical protein
VLVRTVIAEMGNPDDTVWALCREGGGRRSRFRCRGRRPPHPRRPSRTSCLENSRKALSENCEYLRQFCKLRKGLATYGAAFTRQRSLVRSQHRPLRESYLYGKNTQLREAGSGNSLIPQFTSSKADVRQAVLDTRLLMQLITYLSDTTKCDGQLLPRISPCRSIPTAQGPVHAATFSGKTQYGPCLGPAHQLWYPL